MFAHSLTWDLLKWHLIEEKKKIDSHAGNRTPAAAVKAPNPNH